MQIYKIIVNVIFATPDLGTKVLLRPIFEKNELNNMAGLENTLSELSAKSRRTKAWTELVIKPTLLIESDKTTSIYNVSTRVLSKK